MLRPLSRLRLRRPPPPLSPRLPTRTTSRLWSAATTARPATATRCRRSGPPSAARSGTFTPAFVLTTGDAIEGYGDTAAEANAEYDVFLQDVALTGVPVFCAPGNHEFSLDPSSAARLSRSASASCTARLTTATATSSRQLQRRRSRTGPSKAARLTTPQLAWLQSDLEANKGAANTFVFLHHYVFGPPDPDTPTLTPALWTSRRRTASTR